MRGTGANARFLKVRTGGITIDQKAVGADRRFDGTFVLMTNTDLPASEVAKPYKGLWRVERTFRKEKSTLQVRSIYHHRDDTSIGHIMASFLALQLEVDLQAKLDKKGIKASPSDLMRDLSQLQAIRMNLECNPYLIRTDFEGHAYHAFNAAAVRPSSGVTRV